MKEIEIWLNRQGMETIDVICAVMTGTDWPEEYDTLLKTLHAYTGVPRIQVINDCMAALYGGSHCEYGICVMCRNGRQCRQEEPWTRL